MLMLSLLALAAAAPAPLAPVPCVVMNAERMPANRRASALDSLTFTAGKAEVKVCYGRPALKGRAMIGADAVPYGKLWRTGANEPTMLHTNAPVSVAGVTLPPGSYSLYTVPGEKEWEIVLNRSTSQWGHESAYTPEVAKQEAGRGKVKAMKTKAPVERLTFTAEPSATKASKLVLEWENSRVEIPVAAK
jgi:hypothetical protein